MANEKVDVVIVGAGASGAVYASVLAKAGKKVVVLEAGPDWQLTDLISSEMWGRRIRPAGAPILLDGKHPFGYAGQAGWGVGGAALHYFANHPRYLPNDYKIKSEHNRGLDWPISYEDVAPFYDRVAQDVGMSGDAKAEEIWRPAGQPYPMPPMKTFRHGEIWRKGFESLGIRMVPAPVGMNSTEFKGRPACIYDGWCHVGCPTGALSNPVVTYLGEARKAKAEVRALCTATRVLTNSQGTRVTGVEYYDEKKQRQVQEANVVVVAGWSGTNSRILLNSATDKHPKGLANANGLVGKYMMTHSIAGINAMFDEDIQNHLGTIGAQYMSYDRYGKTAYPGAAFGSTYITCGAAQKTHDFANTRPDLFGPELHAHMKRAARGFARISMFGEGLPHLENRIELVSEKDEFGMPLGRLTHGFDDAAVALWNANLEEGQKAAKASGATEVWVGRAAIPTTHLHGGTIMGTGAANSVVNSYGQSHELANLYVAGCGIFPTASSANPTYTLNALSLRGAEQLAANWGSIAS
jgi:choline dehydrogenase-like flavoprotein